MIAFVLGMCSGFVNHLSYLFTEVSQMCINVDNGDVKSALLVLALLLDTTHGALKLLSEVVRRALDVIILLLLSTFDASFAMLLILLVYIRFWNGCQNVLSGLVEKL